MKVYLIYLFYLFISQQNKLKYFLFFLIKNIYLIFEKKIINFILIVQKYLVLFYN